MSVNIHSTAIVKEGAQLDDSVTVGAYAYIGEKVRIGSDTVVHHHATVDGNTEIGSENEVFPYACIGLKTQDLKYQGGNPGLHIGDQNTFREFCTVHSATNDGDLTRIGSKGTFLAYVHIAHDCTVGNSVIMSNNGALAGHVEVEDHVTIGGFSAVHQFCRIGQYAMVGGYSKVIKDIPPFMTCDGNPATIRAYNKVGLQRSGFSEEAISLVRRIYKILHGRGRQGRGLTQLRSLQKRRSDADSELIQSVIQFIERESKRGLT